MSGVDDAAGASDDRTFCKSQLYRSSFSRFRLNIYPNHPHQLVFRQPSFSLSYAYRHRHRYRVIYICVFSLYFHSHPGEFPDLKWGDDLATPVERWLCETHFQKPVFVTDYPAVLKPFYMKASVSAGAPSDAPGATVACMDLLVPGIGELIGGSEREDDYKILKTRMVDEGLDLDTYSYYLDTRKYGSVPHGGFGLGFERLVQFVSGIGNIRDVVHIPRTPGNNPV